MNTLYPSARERFLTKRLDWLSDDFIAVLVAPDYVYDDQHVFLNNLAPAFRLAFAAITNRTAIAGWAGGKCEFVDTNIEQIKSVVVYQNVGDPSSSPLIAYYDTGVGLPTTLSGSYTFRSTGQGYFRL